MELDLSNPKEVLSRCKALFAKEKVDIVMNNGGASMRDCFEDLSLDMIEQMMNVNCTSHIAVVQAALPGFMERKSGQIVNILSLSGLFGMPVRTMYSASKFGLSGFGKAIRAEVAEYNVHVCNVYPEYVQTNISKNALLGNGEKFGKSDPNAKIGYPVEKAVDEIFRAMTLKKTEFILGGLFYQLVPYIQVSQNLTEYFADKYFKKQIVSKAKAS